MTEPKGQFVQGINLTSAVSLVVGSMIGSGIFIVSADIGRQVNSSGLLLLVWTATALITVMGALTQTELVGMYPRAGGQYVFLREGLGPLWGFLYGWTLLLVIQTGTIAAVAVAFARFLGVLVPAVSPDVFLSLGAICSEPFEWPSRPGLPTRMRMRWPISSETSFTRSRVAVSASRSPAGAAPPTPVGPR